MDLGIKGRSAIVCASSKGLGYACARELAANGADVIVNGRSQSSLAEAAQAIERETGAKVTAIAADLNTQGGRSRLLDVCPNPDILVTNNAGPPVRDFHDLDEAAILEGLGMNMVTPIMLAKAIIDGMVERRFGRIVHITSASVKMPILGLDLSSGARAGLTAFFAGIARDVSKYNVTINALLPGLFATERLKNGHKAMAKLKGVDPETFEAERVAQTPAGRLGDPAEFGKACAFLCGADSGYITGQNILIDGGWFNGAF